MKNMRDDFIKMTKEVNDLRLKFNSVSPFMDVIFCELMKAYLGGFDSMMIAKFYVRDEIIDKVKLMGFRVEECKSNNSWYRIYF